MELPQHKQKKSKQSLKKDIFKQIKDGDSEIRYQVENQKIDDQKSQTFGDVEPLIEKSEKWLGISKRSLIGLTALILVLIISLASYFILVSRNQVIPEINQQEDIPRVRNDIFDLVVLNSSSAVCLDGTPGTYYLSRGGNPKNIYIHFEAGGWCGDLTYEKTLQTCYQRSKGFIGSSKFNTPQRGMGGIFSDDVNNYFRDWKKVFFSYCDGAGHQGTRKDPIKYKDDLMYFRGHNLTVQRLESLQEKIGLFSKAQRIVVSGESAGGPASLYWVDYVAKRAKNAKVYALPSSGIFYDSMNQTTNNYDFRDLFINIMNITNQQIDNPLTNCVKEYPNDKYKCMFVQYMHKHIKSPIFIVQSLYDSFSIPVIIGIKCDDNYAYGWPIIKNCKQDKLQVVRQYRKSVSDLVKEIGKDKKNGVWAIDCVSHAYITNNKFFSEYFQVPQNSGNQISKSVQNWIENTTNSHVFIDQVQWPNNKPCMLDAF